MQCSLCRRLGGLWTYYEFGTVRIEGHPENTAEYISRDKTLRTVRCKTCGVLRIGSLSLQSRGQSMMSTSTTLIHVFKRLFQVRHFDERTLANSSTERPCCGAADAFQRRIAAVRRPCLRAGLYGCWHPYQAAPNPAFNRTRRSELFFLGERLWRRAG